MIINLFQMTINSVQTLKETRNNIEAISNNEHKAMLTQIIDVIVRDSDSYYEQYELFILCMKKSM